MLVKNKLGDKIRELRIEQGLTQAELAIRVDTHRPLVSRIEAGTHVPSIPTVVAYADALDVQPSVIFKTLDKEPANLAYIFGNEHQVDGTRDQPSAEHP